VIGIALNLLLTGVLVVYLVRTDPLALGLSAGWILLGGVAYLLLNRIRSSGEQEAETGIDMGPEAEG
jgi:hypothetical protein